MFSQLTVKVFRLTENCAEFQRLNEHEENSQVIQGPSKGADKIPGQFKGMITLKFTLIHFNDKVDKVKTFIFCRELIEFKLL